MRSGHSTRHLLFRPPAIRGRHRISHRDRDRPAPRGDIACGPVPQPVRRL